MNILIAEDDASERLLLTEALEGQGHQVKAVADGKEAWGAFRKDYYPLVIADWMMPTYSGPELCQMIRSLSREHYTFIVMLTAMRGKARYLEGMDAGADDFISKPVDLDELKARLRAAERMLGLHGRVRQLEGLLSICSYCKKIRNDCGTWVGVEEYIEGRTELSFSHGMCHGCGDRLRAELEDPAFRASLIR